MKYQQFRNNNQVFFTQWSRKNYAIFASLHQCVKIVRSSIDICISALSKNKNILKLNAEVLNEGISESDSEQTENVISNGLSLLFIKLGLLKLNESTDSSELKYGI